MRNIILNFWRKYGVYNGFHVPFLRRKQKQKQIEKAKSCKVATARTS